MRDGVVVIVVMVKVGIRVMVIMTVVGAAMMW